MFSQQLLQQAEKLIGQCTIMGCQLVTAESCTGGLLAALLTEIAGSSRVYQQGYITYSNESKQRLLDVMPLLLESMGAVSSEVACAMAEGALANSTAHYAIAITGIAGPAGGSTEKPVGLVYIAIGQAGNTPQYTQHHFSGNRSEIRLQAVEHALQKLQSVLRLT